MIIFNIQRTSEIRLCLWCGQFFINPKPLQKYCSKNCQKYAGMEANKIRQRRFRDKYSIKQKTLGTTNLREHAKEDFTEELELIKKERIRLGLQEWNP